MPRLVQLAHPRTRHPGLLALLLQLYDGTTKSRAPSSNQVATTPRPQGRPCNPSSGMFGLTHQAIGPIGASETLTPSLSG